MKGHGHPGQLSANEGAKDEPQTKGHADQAEGPGSLLRRSDVGEHGAGCCRRTATDAVNDPCGEQRQQGQQALEGPRQCNRHGKQAEPHDGSCDADADHRAAAVAITERSDQGSDQELRQGIASRQQSQGSSIWGEEGQENVK